MSYKILYLLRHAKADPSGPYTPDHPRTLAEKGEKQAVARGRFMVQHNMVPAQVLCSGARRTRQTWDLASEAFSPVPPTEYTDAQYNVGLDAAIALLRQVADDIPSLLAVGHNPTFHQLAATLPGDGEEDLLEAVTQRFPPCSLAQIRFDVASWRDIGPGKGRLLALDFAE